MYIILIEIITVKYFLTISISSRKFETMIEQQPVRNGKHASVESSDTNISVMGFRKSGEYNLYE